MAYYSYPYQPNYFSNYPAQQQTQQSNGVNWVQGEAGALYNRLSNCHVPTVPVYGRQPIFTCGSQGCGCGA